MPAVDPYFTYRRFMEERYGYVLHRVPIDLGFGCPNRQADASGGCCFCAADGGRARQILGIGDVRDQVEAVKAEPITAKGKSEPLEIYEVIGLR